MADEQNESIKRFLGVFGGAKEMVARPHYYRAASVGIFDYFCGDLRFGSFYLHFVLTRAQI